MYKTCSDTVTGAFTPHTPIKLVDVANRESTQKRIVVPKMGVNGPYFGAPSTTGPAALFGTFISICNKFNVARFWNTTPLIAIPQLATLPRYNKQVQNPTLLNVEPGFTQDLPYGQDSLEFKLNLGPVASPAIQ